MASSAGRVYARLVSPVRGKIVVAVFLTILSSIGAFLPYVAIARVAQIALTEGIPDIGGLVFWIVLAIAGAFFSRIFFSVATGICHYADADFRVHARTVLTEHLGKVPLGWFSDNSSAQVKQAATDDVLNMHQSVGHAPVDITSAVLTPLLPLIYLFMVDWRFSLVMLAFFVVALGIAAPLMFKDFDALSKGYNDALVELSSATVEMIDGIAVVKTFGSSSRASRRFGTAVSELTDICYLWTKKTANPSSIIFALFSPAVMLVVLLAIALWFVTMGWMSFAACIPFLVLGVGIPAALVNLFTPLRFLQQSLQGAGHMGTIFEVDPLAEPEQPRTVEASGLQVAFEDVSFSYGEDMALALDGVTATLEPGTVTALVGSSGSGKTTFARLVPRFWDPTRGSVKLSGVDVRDMMTSDVLSLVTVVFQDTIMLRETIRDNIRLGKPHAGEDEVIAAAKCAQIHERITELPCGYETVVGSDDGNLSGGEMQRVAIARAMLQDAPILVLDEATAHADPENETAIQKALSNLAQGRTTIVIAHRLNTIKHVDQIIVMDGGSIVERGRHEELLAAGGQYAALWESQRIGDEEAFLDAGGPQDTVGEGVA